MADQQIEYAALTRRSGALMATLCLAQVLEVLGVTVVIVALPAIGADLELSDARLQLVVSLYAVLYGGLLLAAGRLADRVDRRTVFAVGIAVTLIGALCCALAPSGGVLLAGRAVQGVGGALVTPAALSLLTSSFTAGPARRIAVSAWTAAAAGGGAVGFAAGGLLVHGVGWRSVFWLLTGLAVVVLALLWWVVPARPPSGDRGLDLPGTLTITTGLVLLVWGAGLVEHPADAPLPAPLVIGVGLVLLAGFAAAERRTRTPLVAWSELTNRAFMTANAAAFVNTATTSASGTLIALVAQRGLQLDARVTGLVLLPFSVAVVIGSALGSWWLRRRSVIGMAAGLATVAIAMLGLAWATRAGSVAGLAVSVAVAGAGLSWAALTSTSAATQALPPERQGVASGAVNTAAQIGTALGVAVLLSVAAAVGVEGETTGYVVAFVVAAVLAATYAALLPLLRRGDP